MEARQATAAAISPAVPNLPVETRLWIEVMIGDEVKASIDAEFVRAESRRNVVTRSQKHEAGMISDSRF